jgi:hypothetical protein
VPTIALDITDPERVALVAEVCDDVALLVNNVEVSELAHQGTLVVAVHASFIDTDMAAGTDAPKISPDSVAQQTLDAVEADQIEVLADARPRFVKESLSRDHELIYPPVQAFWDSLRESRGQLRGTSDLEMGGRTSSAPP